VVLPLLLVEITLGLHVMVPLEVMPSVLVSMK
jgi:hypothetical protein